MRATRLFMLCALLGACGKTASLTPPIYAPLPASDADGEAIPKGRLPSDTHPLGYQLALELVPGRETYSGEVAIEVALDRPRESIWLHQRGIRASKVRVVRPNADALAGTLEAVGDSGLSAVRLAQPVGPGIVRLEITFEADVGKQLSGLYRAQAGGAPYLFTQFEAISAREAFPCFDEPRFKTPFDITLRVPADQVAITNTREVASKPVAGGLREVKFARTERLPTYLIAFAVGPLDVADAAPLPASDARARTVPLRGVAVKGRGGELGHALRETPRLLLPLERYFAIGYPYDKLDLIAVPDFGAGAMENAGAITFRDSILLVRDDATEGQKRLLAYVNAHELAHQWFGNLVTMPWWDDIWLNEAFATWMGTRVVDEVYPEYEARLGALTSTHYAMDVDSQAAARQIRQPIESDHDIVNAFDAITYSKGGSVLSMFERYLGPEQFRAGLRLYMQRHQFASATARDLVDALAEASHDPAVGPAFFSFLDQPGVPLVRARVDCSAQSPLLVLSQERYLPLGSAARRDATWQVPVCVRYGGNGQQQEQCALLRERELRLPLDTQTCPAWLMPNAGAEGYYRWSLEPEQLEQLMKVEAQLAPAEQVSLASNLLAALRAGALDADRALDGLSRFREPRRLVLETVLKSFVFVRDKLLDAASLPGYRAQVRELMLPTYRRLGMFAPAGAQVSGEEKLQRAVSVRALALAARDPEVTKPLVSLGKAQLGLGQDPRLAELPSELIEVAIAAAIREGGAPVLERAIAQLTSTDDGVARARLLAAIVITDDPALSERVLALALDPRLRNNERLSPLLAQAAQVETREHAYTWLKTNFDKYTALLTGHARSDALGALANFCSADKAQDAQAFFDPRAESLPGGPRALSLALESIRLCEALAAAQAEKARAHFTRVR